MARGTIKAKKRKWADGKSEEEVSPAYACMHMREREREREKRERTDDFFHPLLCTNTCACTKMDDAEEREDDGGEGEDVEEREGRENRAYVMEKNLSCVREEVEEGKKSLCNGHEFPLHALKRERE